MKISELPIKETLTEDEIFLIEDGSLFKKTTGIKDLQEFAYSNNYTSGQTIILTGTTNNIIHTVNSNVDYVFLRIDNTGSGANSYIILPPDAPINKRISVIVANRTTASSFLRSIFIMSVKPNVMPHEVITSGILASVLNLYSPIAKLFRSPSTGGGTGFGFGATYQVFDFIMVENAIGNVKNWIQI
jgi:hypothetical protein